MSLRRFVVPVASLSLALFGAASLIVSSGNAQPTRPAATADQAYQAAVVAQVAAAASQMTTAGYHDLDVAVEGGTIPSGALGRVRRARVVVAATQWPEALRAQAQALVDASQQVEQVLPSEELAAIGGPVHELHEAGDAFIAAAYNWLATVPSGQAQP